MARLKYAEDVSPISNEHSGITFQRNNYGQSALRGQANDRFRKIAQDLRRQGNQKAVRFWRSMSPAQKSLWENFAATYPQVSRKQPGVFLSGYELFVKRNSYCFLNHGLQSDFMLEPEFYEVPENVISFETVAVDGAIDCTDNYIARFGLLPKVGDKLLLRAVLYVENSGQFFAPVETSVIVTNMYIDGLFVYCNFPDEWENLVVSLFLSKPVSAGVSYVGSKTRYMGCFTKKKFTDLTDVPAVTPADEGKVWGVDENGDWSLIEGGGGGGLTCNDLINCPTIIDIINRIENLEETVTTGLDTSIPPVTFGLLYNRYAAFNAKQFAPAGWHIITETEVQYLFTFLGGASVAGGKLKQDSLLYWDSPNTGADNSTAFNGRGSGIRLFNGNFDANMADGRIWEFYDPSPAATIGFLYGTANSAAASRGLSVPNTGLAVRLVKDSTTLSNGDKSFMTGNDGKIYRTICIGNLEIMADNSAETKYRDGSAIPEITDNAAWQADASGALCAYDNDWSFV